MTVLVQIRPGPCGQVEKFGGCHPVQTVSEPECGVKSDRLYTQNIGVSGVIGLSDTLGLCENTECVRGEFFCMRGFQPRAPFLCKKDPSPISL